MCLNFQRNNHVRNTSKLSEKKKECVAKVVNQTHFTGYKANRDAMYSLEGMVEFDEGCFEKATPAGIKLKRGKGSVKRQNVAVMAESIPLESLETGKKNKAVRYFKMQVLNSHKKEAVNQTV